MSTTDTPIYEATLAEYVAAGLGLPFRPTDSDEILDSLEASGVAKADQFDALVAVQKLITPLHPDYRDWTYIRNVA